MKIKCDECNKTFEESTIHIYEQDVNIENRILSLTYFCCPRCGKIFPCALISDDMKEIQKDMQEQRAKLSRMIKKQESFGKGIYNPSIVFQIKSVQKKLDRLKIKSDKLMQRFNGQFAFNEDGEIVYLP